MNTTKCSTIGCQHGATRVMSWRDPYGMVAERVTEAVCDEDLASFSRRPAMQARDEGPVR